MDVPGRNLPFRGLFSGFVTNVVTWNSRVYRAHDWIDISCTRENFCYHCLAPLLSLLGFVLKVFFFTDSTMVNRHSTTIWENMFGTCSKHLKQNLIGSCFLNSDGENFPYSWKWLNFPKWKKNRCILPLWPTLHEWTTSLPVMYIHATMVCFKP